MAGVRDVFTSVPWWAWVAIIGTVGVIIRQLMHMSHKHSERMEMIRQGMDPRDADK